MQPFHEPVFCTQAPSQLDKRQWYRSAVPSISVQTPYDPAPLMERLRRRIKTDRYRFAVFGDTHHSPALPDIIRLVREHGADFVVTVGDLVDLGGGREGPEHYGRLAAEAGDFLRALPVWAALGNHDVDSRWDYDHWNGVANFKAFYNLQPYYSFDFRNARFIFLSWMLPDELELQWLELQLKSAILPHIFVISHWPLLTHGAIAETGSEKWSEPVRALLARRRVTALLSGHDHVYYRTVRDGVNCLLSAGVHNIMTVGNVAGKAARDSYYGRESQTGDYVFRSEKGERRWKEMQHLVVMISVSGATVTGQVLSTASELWEEFAFAG